jgi:proteasome lid subunit RPN8/RPN11
MPPDAVTSADAGWDDGVLASLYQVALATPDREAAGVLVGTPALADRPAQVHAVIPVAQSTVPEHVAQFTHQTWAYIHQTMADHYGGLEVVGWYVSRPGAGTDVRDSEQANHLAWFSRGQQMLLIFDSRTYRGSINAPAGPAGRLTQMHEGPIARRYVRPAKADQGYPLLGLLIVVLFGVLAGALAFVITEAFSTL